LQQDLPSREQLQYCPTPGQPCENLAKCGNGILTSDETCDDGNTLDGDGCSKDCKTIEKGWQCRVPGKPCTPKCGDGIISGTETCDDGNTASGDGCSATCHLELGLQVRVAARASARRPPAATARRKAPRAATTATPCPSMAARKTARSSRTCTAGSRMHLPVWRRHRAGRRQCDDGNVGKWRRLLEHLQDRARLDLLAAAHRRQMKVPVIYRDFKFSKDVTNGNDFETGVSGSYNPTTGMVNASLDAKGKPVLSSTAPSTAHVASAASFATWYTDVSGTNHATASKMTLWNDGKGNYVNRYGANGEQWNITTPANYCGTVH
jgi:cysteine-rich repeat protein